MKSRKNLLERALFYSCLTTVFVAFIACLPALFVPIGFLAEGDALDYRVPILKWMLRHRSYPNWSWTFVDDYPMLGELLMLPFFAIKQELARVIPILAYIGTAACIGGIGCELLPKHRAHETKAFFLFIFASTLGLQPLLVQADHVMVDNLANFFALASLWLLLREKTIPSAILMACALGTRYMIWGAAPGAIAALLWLRAHDKKTAVKSAILFTAIASLGAMPFLLRNWALNENPFYPLLNGLFKGAPIGAFDGWGRNKGITGLLLFPYDLLYTNSFVKAIFDTNAEPKGFYIYKLTFLFYLQLASFIAIAIVKGRSTFSFFHKTAYNPKAQAVFLFTLCYFIFWWAGSHQLRFLTCGIALLNLFILALLFTRLPKATIVVFSLLPLLSIASTRQESWRILFGNSESFQKSAYVASAKNCFARAGVNSTHLIGYSNRDMINGYFNFDFIFLSPHNLYFEQPGNPTLNKADFIYSGLDFTDRAGFIRWPQEKPCLLKRI